MELSRTVMEQMTGHQSRVNRVHRLPIPSHGGGEPAAAAGDAGGLGTHMKEEDTEEGRKEGGKRGWGWRKSTTQGVSIPKKPEPPQIGAVSFSHPSHTCTLT